MSLTSEATPPRDYAANIAFVARVDCMGCGACAVACPINCITMEHDDEGFLEPRIDGVRCVNCSKCVKACNALNVAEYHGSRRALLYRSLVPESEGSSSGGAAYTLGRTMIERGGAVIACAFDRDGNARHITADSADGLVAMQGSKYVQSDAREGYSECLRLLRQGDEVLFIGTPCQVAAVKSLCGAYDGLVTCDLVCHGVPSPLFWQRNLDYQNGLGNLEPRQDVQFRTHSKRSRVCFALHCRQCSAKQIPFELDPFFNLFINNASLRESCYTCRFARPERVGDITIGDCASIDHYLGFHDEMPVSTLCANTDAGLALVNEATEAFDCDFVELDYEREARLNKQLHDPAVRPPLRDAVYSDLRELDYPDFAGKYVARPGLPWHIRRAAKALIPIKARVFLKRMKGRVLHG